MIQPVAVLSLQIFVYSRFAEFDYTNTPLYDYLDVCYDLQIVWVRRICIKITLAGQIHSLHKQYYACSAFAIAGIATFIYGIPFSPSAASIPSSSPLIISSISSTSSLCLFHCSKKLACLEVNQ